MNHRTRLPLLPVLLLAVVAPLAHAQTFYFSNGRQASLPAARVVGDMIKLPIDLGDGASGEIGLPISDIVRLDWPEPPELAGARTLLNAGRAADVVKITNVLLPVHEPFQDIAGSWWAQVMMVRVEAFARLGRDVDAEVAIERLRRSKTGTAFVGRGALILVAALADSGKTVQARERLKTVDLSSAEENMLARVALIRGRLLRDEGKPEEALLSYLRVPALHAGERDLQPAALLGALICYQTLGETARAAAMLASLNEHFPDSPEAAKARETFNRS